MPNEAEALCSETLMSGLKKGEPCPRKAHSGPGTMCRFHETLKRKSSYKLENGEKHLTAWQTLQVGSIIYITGRINAFDKHKISYRYAYPWTFAKITEKSSETATAEIMSETYTVIEANPVTTSSQRTPDEATPFPKVVKLTLHLTGALITDPAAIQEHFLIKISYRKLGPLKTTAEWHLWDGKPLHYFTGCD